MKAVDHTAVMKTIQGREIAALLNPRPAALVTCCDADGNANVLSVAWHTPLSHNPPLLGISIDTRHYSHKLIAEIGEFTLNVVGNSFREAVEFCGNCSGKEIDKISRAGLTLIPAHFIRTPFIAGALAYIECTVVSQVHTGDHTFFIGKILYAEAQADCFSDCWDSAHGDVLLCLQRDRFYGDSKS